MRHLKGLSVTFAAAALLLAAQARAGEWQASQQQSQDPSVGVGVICNTTEQAEHYLTLRAAGQDVTPAVQRVNADAQQPRACGIAAIAFRTGKTMDSKTINGKLLKIVQVTIVAGYDGRGWHPVADALQFAIVETDGYAI